MTLNASYDGNWDEASQQWKGILTEGQAMPLNWQKGAPPAKPVLAGMDGIWRGVVERNGARLRQAMRIATGEKGTNILYDSPDQMAIGLPVKDLVRKGQAVRFSVMGRAGVFEGSLSADATQLTGTWAA